MNNYEFCVYWICNQDQTRNYCILDFGCGSGDIVKELRQQNVDAFGCDIFYGGGGQLSDVDPILVESNIIRVVENNKIPFERAKFDIIVNNQVMEHVKDIDVVLMEFQRVLKPDGIVLSIFPTREVWREGHCGIPFLHWFSKNSTLRIYYAAAFRMLGFGYFKRDKSVMRWSRDFCQWLDNWTYYRTQEEIDKVYAKYFIDIDHIEDYWLRARLGGGRSEFGPGRSQPSICSTPAARWSRLMSTWLVAIVTRLPALLQKLIALKLAGNVLVAREPF